MISPSPDRLNSSFIQLALSTIAIWHWASFRSKCGEDGPRKQDGIIVSLTTIPNSVNWLTHSLDNLVKTIKHNWNNFYKRALGCREISNSRMILTLAATGSDPVAPLCSCLITSPNWPWFCGEIKMPVNWQLQIVFRKPKKSRFIILSSSVSPVHISGNVAWKSSNSPWDRTSKAPFLNFEAIWFINGNKSWRSLNWTPRRNDDKALGSSTKNHISQWNFSFWSTYRECRSSSK